MNMIAARCDLFGYLDRTFFESKNNLAQIVVDYCDDRTIVFENRETLYVDEDYSVKPPAYETIKRLMKSLQDHCPLVAGGRMGPGAYKKPPFELKEKLYGKDLFGFQPDSFDGHASSIEVILIGARQLQSRSYIYYIRAQDITSSKYSLIRGFKSHSTDFKIYVMSYDNFLNRSLTDLHPICPHGHWLFSIPVNSIIDRGIIEKQCKQIGQQIFDHYKELAAGNSEAGMNAVKRICEAAKFLTLDGSTRKSHIESAWNGVGDETWRWLA